MICEECPLAYHIRTCWECEEYELMCAVTDMPTADSVKDFNSGCTRTNKWIKSQNIEDLKRQREEREAKYWEEYAIEKGYITKQDRPTEKNELTENVADNDFDELAEAGGKFE